MCGLVGMFGRPFDADKKAFRNLLFLDTLRGRDSTGVAVISDDNKLTLAKKTGVPHRLWEANPNLFTADGVYKTQGKVFIGHNRAATKGSINDDNAHPFHYNTVVGAHNGTLRGVHRLEDGNKFDVDSQAIFNSLDKYDVLSVIPDIHGAYALTWYDFQSKTVNVIRNDERPLFWTRREDGDVIYWASESWMLSVALNKANVKFGKIEEFKKDTLYSFDVEDVSYSNFRKHDWLTTEGVEGYKPPVYVHKPNKQTNTNTTNTNTGGTKSNVSPFPQTSSNSSAKLQETDDGKSRWSKMKALGGKEFKFRFNEVKKALSGAEYLCAYPESPFLDFEVRVFGKGHSNWEQWKANVHKTTFTGLVRRAVKNNLRGKMEYYLLVDLRTVKEVDNSVTAAENKMLSVEDVIDSATRTVDTSLLYNGFNGAYLNEEEWHKCTAKGCAGCTSPADPTDEALVFIEHDEFLCGDCSTVEYYQDYIPSHLRVNLK